MTQTATIDQLRPGSEYPDGNINARLHYTDAEIEELAASLKGPDGQLRPFLVATHSKKPKVYFVFGGGRRRMAFERLIERGDLPKDHPIEIKDHGHISVQEALSKSFADNQHVPMHPADQAQTFAKLAADKSAEEIAKERGMTVRAVQQSIALGTALAPDAIAEWRNGNLTRDAVEALTIADLETQTEIVNEFRENGWMIRVNDLRRRLMRDKEPEMKRLLGLVGVAEFRANGGEVIEDFFGQGGNVKDMKLLKKMARAKMEQEADRLRSEGWSWVETRLNRNHMHHGMGEMRVKQVFTSEEKARIETINAELKNIREGMAESEEFDSGSEGERLENERERIEQDAELRAFTPQQRAKGGVIIELENDGSLYFKAGLTRRDEPKKAAGNGSPTTAQPQRPEEAVNWQVRHLLTEWQDDTARELMRDHPKEAAAMFLAAIGQSHINRDVPIQPDLCYQWEEKFSKAKGFEAQYKDLLNATPAIIQGFFGRLAANCIDISDTRQGFKKSAQIVIDIVGAQKFADALAKKFNAKEYFGGCSKAHMLGAIKEALGETIRAEQEKCSADDVRRFAVANVAKTGWLPPELRTKLYKAPATPKGTVAKIAPKAKAAKKKPAPKRKAA